MKQEICKCPRCKVNYLRIDNQVENTKTNSQSLDLPQQEENAFRSSSLSCVRDDDMFLNKSSSVAQQPNINKIYKKLYRDSLGYEDDTCCRLAYRNALKDFKKELIKNGK